MPASAKRDAEGRRTGVAKRGEGEPPYRRVPNGARERRGVGER